MNISFTEHIRQMLLLAKDLVRNNPSLTSEVGTVNAKGDKTIGMDVKVEEILIDYIKKNNIPANIFSEEVGEIKFHPNPEYFIAFDPLDGSTNYKIGKNIFPYGLLIAVYKGLQPKLKDVITSGAIEYTKDLAWIYTDGKTADFNGNPIILKQDWIPSKSTPIFLDLYYKEGYELYRPLAQQLFIRNIGSTIGNLSYVLENIAAGLGGVCMRPEEIGAIYSLIKGAGGITVNHKGEDIGDMPFTPNTTYQILAGSKNIIDFAIEKLKSLKKY